MTIIRLRNFGFVFSGLRKRSVDVTQKLLLASHHQFTNQNTVIEKKNSIMIHRRLIYTMYISEICHHDILPNNLVLAPAAV